MNCFKTCAFILLSWCSAVSAETSDCARQHCIAVVDAGSSGSRLHVYAYATDEKNYPRHIEELWNKKITPGFATIDPTPSTIDTYLSNLLDTAPIKNIPIYFYATAGMRLLPKTKQKIYYYEVNQWFTRKNEWSLQDAKTLTGTEEGLYDWLAVNDHLGTLSSSTQLPVGVMDMGGASVQIAVPIARNSATEGQSTVQLDIYDKHYTLYVHSFLGLGQNELAHQFLNSASCFITKYLLPDGGVGQGDAFSCELEVATLINQVHGVKQLIQPILAMNPVDSWYAIGGVTNLLDSQLLHFNDNEFTNAELLRQGDNQICHQVWDSLSQQVLNDDFLYEYCLFSASYYALMVDGYGLNPEQTIHYLPAKEAIDWTTGVVLSQHQ